MIPWTEKYRPKEIEAVSSQEEVVSALRNSIDLNAGSLSHLLFYGPPGTGKTSTILALSEEMFGSEVNSRVLKLNASDDRGIDAIRTKIKDFANLAVNTYSDLPPFKIIILDEADSMTEDAQSALRRIIEKHTKVTRFCIICNYISKIIDPLVSRCAKFKFSPLSKESMIKRLEYIAKEEHLIISNNVWETLIDISKGDMRESDNYITKHSYFKFYYN